ncbi:hypothetical protein BPOR_1246g00010 [Botrytis porri]|uniref:Secreted protein n=1 Tax=Botrytis porri TaxID=87229 RepID=A0A4Z1KJ96_9HELO|nr:hypothetical protein BPOR_1246g00010 [Botrytis porri]
MRFCMSKRFNWVLICIYMSQYIEALTGAGSGITVLSAPKVEEDRATTALNSPKPNAIGDTVHRYVLTLQRLKCHCKQNDAVFGPKNEIY